MREEIRFRRFGKTGLLLVAVLVFLGGCTNYQASNFRPPPPMVQTGIDELHAPPGAAQEGEVVAPSLPPLAAVEPQVAVEESLPFEGMMFSLSARNTPLRDVLLGVAKEAGLNLIIEKGVDSLEPVSVEMHDLPLRLAMDTFLSSYAYYYSIEGNILRVKALETRIMHFQYPTVVHSSTSSLGGDMMGNSDASSMSGDFSISAELAKEQVDVWQQIEDALQPSAPGGKGGFLSAEGRAQVNRASGTIIVTDRQEYLNLVEDFLYSMEQSLRRQVVIEAKILEVTLTEGHRYGINWQAVINRSSRTAITLNAQNTLAGTAPLQMFSLVAANAEGTLSLTNAFIDLLSQEGAVNVLSSPRVNVMNNQSALITMGTSLPYLDWQVNSQADPANAGATITTIVPRVETAQAGVSLGVTPQIDGDGITTLHITPVITRSTNTQAFTYNGNTWTVPIIDMRASDTIARVRNGETIVLGGMITESMNENESKITGLGNLPLLGKLLFTGETRAKSKTELVILLTPTIVTR